MSFLFICLFVCVCVCVCVAMYSGLARDVTDTDCWAKKTKNGTTHGLVYAIKFVLFCLFFLLFLFWSVGLLLFCLSEN